MKWLRMFLLSTLLVLMAFSSTFAYDYMSDVDAVTSEPMTAYNTVYLGMPMNNFKGAFDDIKGWEKNHDEIGQNKEFTTYTRKYSNWVEFRSNPVVRERVCAVSVNGAVSDCSFIFYTNTLDAAMKIYSRMYNNLRTKLWEPEFYTRLPYVKRADWKNADGSRITISYSSEADIDMKKDGLNYQVMVGFSAPSLYST